MSIEELQNNAKNLPNFGTDTTEEESFKVLSDRKSHPSEDFTSYCRGELAVALTDALFALYKGGPTKPSDALNFLIDTFASDDIRSSSTVAGSLIRPPHRVKEEFVRYVSASGFPRHLHKALLSLHKQYKMGEVPESAPHFVREKIISLRKRRIEKNRSRKSIEDDVTASDLPRSLFMNNDRQYAKSESRIIENASARKHSVSKDLKESEEISKGAVVENDDVESSDNIMVNEESTHSKENIQRKDGTIGKEARANNLTEETNQVEKREVEEVLELSNVTQNKVSDVSVEEKESSNLEESADQREREPEISKPNKSSDETVTKQESIKPDQSSDEQITEQDSMEPELSSDEQIREQESMKHDEDPSVNVAEEKTAEIKSETTATDIREGETNSVQENAEDVNGKASPGD